MFEKLDRPLHFLRSVVNIAAIIWAFLVAFDYIFEPLLLGETEFFKEADAMDFILWLIAFATDLFIVWLSWLGARFVLMVACDIKIIRNRLYRKNLNSFDDFLTEQPMFEVYGVKKKSKDPTDGDRRG